MSEYFIKSPRKLIEVALPLDAINTACAKEKTVRNGHPSSLHLWWARRPLAAARAVIFAQLVNDPGYQQGGGFKYGKNKKEASAERNRLFKILESLVDWDNSNDEKILEAARVEIERSWKEVCELNADHPDAKTLFDPNNPPGLHDPFAGGGAIPLEAQRLGLKSYASDLNPVPVLINKAMIEIPPVFAGKEPINSKVSKDSQLKLGQSWPGATGLAQDVAYYGNWMLLEAKKRIAHLYPQAAITAEMAVDRPDLKSHIGKSYSVIAWIWARTVNSPNPAFSHVEVPLASSFVLSNRKGNEAYVQPVVTNDSYSFEIKIGPPPESAQSGTTAGKRKAFKCLISEAPIDYNYIRDQGQAGRLGHKLMAVVVEGPRGRIYLPPTAQSESVALSATPQWKPDLELTGKCRVNVSNYGYNNYGDLFTRRQLVALTTFSDLLNDLRSKIKTDALGSGWTEGKCLRDGGSDALAYSEAVSVYLAFCIDKMADLGNSLVRWEPIAQCPRQLFGRQAIPMIWDFAESNPLGDSSGSWNVSVEGFVKALDKNFQGVKPTSKGTVSQADAQTQEISRNKFISSDPPYYDNISYADLSDFFYVWLRKGLRPVFPELLATISVPKSEELVASPHRHGSVQKAEIFFLDGMTLAMKSLSEKAHPEAPITIYYAFKQSETSEEGGTVSAGWVTFLGAVFQAGLQLTGTWPLRTENASRMVGQGANALASSIVLVCRKRPKDAQTISRREFVREINLVLPEALDEMTKGAGDDRSPVAPVDLSQAIIGPGMAVFSKYKAVLEADGTLMSVKTALLLINRFLAEDDFDADTQFCLHWFEQHGWKDGAFGDADTLARGKGTSVEGVKDAGVIQSGGGKVRMLKWSEYPKDWDPLTDNRTPIWEALHHLIRALKRDGGETASGALLAALGGKAEAVRQLAYRLYTLCERLGQAEDARAYNELITSWTGIETAAASAPKPTDGQLPGFENN